MYVSWKVYHIVQTLSMNDILLSPAATFMAGDPHRGSVSLVL